MKLTKKSFLWALFTLLWAVSCREGGINPINCRDGRCTYEVLANSQLETWSDSTGFYFRIVEGDKLVFRYFYNQNESPQIADDEYTELLLFEIDPNTTNFSFKDSSMLDAKFLFHPSCECLAGTTFIVDGELEGAKLNENFWEINMDVRFMWGSQEERNIQSRFEVVD